VPLRLLVIVGPTASGKTRFGVNLAHALGSEIVSADSRQVYRGLDIGSGKDMQEYRQVTPAVRCHLIDVADPRSVYTVFHYQRDCYRVLEDRQPEISKGDVPLLMVGGTGLYVEAVLRGYRIANVPEDVELRRRLMQREHDELVRELGDLDPELARRTDCHSKKRVVRALEIVSYGRRRPVCHSDPPPPFGFAVFGIHVPREELFRRIDVRLDERLEQGLVAEVQELLDAGVAPERMELLGLEYREVTAYLTGAKTEQQMTDDLRHGIRRFAKRQLTYFRGFPRRGIELTWVGPDDHEFVLQHPWVVAAG